MNKRLSLVLILLSLFLWACSGGVSGTGDGGDPAASQVEEDAPPLAGSGSGSGDPSVTLQDITLDRAMNRVLIVDSERKAVIAIDYDSGVSSLISDSNKPDASNAFEDPRSIAVDESASRALVVDTGRKAIIAVDLSTGARSVFSSNTAPGGEVRFNNPLGIVIDSAHSRALVTDNGLHAIIAVDLLTGERTIIGNQ